MKNFIDDIEFYYQKSENQNNLFSPKHTKFDCMIKYRNQEYSFDYQCNLKFSMPNKKDCLNALLTDAHAYNSSFDVDDFLKNYNYDDSLDSVRKGEAIYKTCEKTSQAIHTLFTEEELEIINAYVNDELENDDIELD